MQIQVEGCTRREGDGMTGFEKTMREEINEKRKGGQR